MNLNIKKSNGDSANDGPKVGEDKIKCFIPGIRRKESLLHFFGNNKYNLRELFFNIFE